MNARWGITLVGAAVLVSGFAAINHPAYATGATGNNSMNTYRITIGGAPGGAFHAECWIRTGAAETSVTFDGPVPQKREFAGDALRCGIRQISAQGSLMVELSSSNGNRTTSRTQGGASTINLSIR